MFDELLTALGASIIAPVDNEAVLIEYDGLPFTTHKVNNFTYYMVCTPVPTELLGRRPFTSVPDITGTAQECKERLESHGVQVLLNKARREKEQDDLTEKQAVLAFQYAEDNGMEAGISRTEMVATKTGTTFDDTALVAADVDFRWEQKDGVYTVTIWVLWRSAMAQLKL